MERDPEIEDYVTADEADITDDEHLTDDAGQAHDIDESDEDSSSADEGLPPFKRRRRDSSIAPAQEPEDVSVRSHTHGDKRSSCPVEGCHGRSKHLKHHAWEYHIPRVFWDRPWNELNASPDYHSLRASCLLALAQYILGPAATVQDLVDYVNKKIPLPREYPIMQRTLHQVGQLTRMMRWPMKDTFSMLPINSPAVLIHWRILMAIVCTMSPEKRAEFRAWGKEDLAKLENRVKSRRVSLQRVDQEFIEQGEDKAEEEEWTVVDECGGETEVYEVAILKEGYAVSVEEQNKVRTGGTITLLKGPMTIIVNTGHPKDKDHILEGLQKNDVSVDDVECCICTNCNVDFVGNLNLFPDTVYIASFDMCLGDLHLRHDFESGQPFPIDKYVDVISTPGSSCTDVSVLVKDTELGTVAIVGDLFQCQEDLVDPVLWRKNSLNPDRQEKSRTKILQMADYIVPGRGKMFKVPI